MRAVVGLVVGVANALNGSAAHRTGKVEAPMNGHLRTKSRNLLGEGRRGFGIEAVDPELQRIACGVEEALPLLWCELMSLKDGREPGGVQNHIYNADGIHI